MRSLPIAAFVLGLLPAHGHPEAFLRPVGINDPRGFDWTFNSDVTRQMPAWQMTQRADKNADPTSSAKGDAIQTANNSLNAICETLRSSASANGLPLTFLTRLIWQESRFDTFAISRAGARGIAQFMPGTAAWVGLRNPFEASDAIRKSAEFLRDLDTQFGNLGLAAAAYNAGPKRVQDWLANRRDLPAQTQAYVRIVTGRTADDWKSSRSTGLSPIAGETVSCPQLAKVLADRSASTLTMATKASTVPALLHEPAWGVQLLADNSKASVLAAYRQLQARYQSVLGQRQPLVIPSKVGRAGYWYRVRIAVESLRDAQKLCSSLRDLGGSCLVQRN